MAALVFVIGGVAFVPSASAATTIDRCNGIIEDDGCTTWDGQSCRLYVAGTCVRGG